MDGENDVNRAPCAANCWDLHTCVSMLTDVAEPTASNSGSPTNKVFSRKQSSINGVPAVSGCECNGYLVLMAGPLTIFSQAFQCLVDEGHVLFIDVESQKAQPTSGAATDTVQELQCLTDQVIISLVVLATQEVLRGDKKNKKIRSD